MKYSSKIYYYIIERHGENIGHLGYYMTLQEAENRILVLEDMFPGGDFYVYPNPAGPAPFRRKVVFIDGDNVFFFLSL